MLTRKELAQGLDISEPMVSRLVARGMPDSSVAEAEGWRRESLNPAKVKRGRCVTLRPASELVTAAEQAIALAGLALDHGNEAGFDALVPPLRAALSAVPKHARAGVKVRFDVMDRLVAWMHDLLMEGHAADPQDGDLGPLTDADADLMGSFWYSIAAGESPDMSEF